MFLIGGALYTILGGLFVYKYCRFQFSQKTIQKTFFILSCLFVVQQIIQIGWLSSERKWYDMQYTDLSMMDVVWCTIAGFTFNKSLIRLLTPFTFLNFFATFFFGNWELYPHDLDWVINTFWSHTLLGIFGVASFVMVRDYTKKDLRNSYIYGYAFLVYVAVVSVSLQYIFHDKKFYYNTTAMFPETYLKGNSYYFFTKIGIMYPVPTILLYAIASAFVYGHWVGIRKFHASTSIRQLVLQKNLTQ